MINTLNRYFQELETPFYFYDIGLLRRTLTTIKNEVSSVPYHVHYALKANVNNRLLKEILSFGFGADCVSGNEVIKALKAGFPSKQIVFAGVGKTDREILTALENDIFSFNVESIQELEIIDQLAGRIGRKARFALRLNPNVDPETHEYITTGKRDNKFGITFDGFLSIIEKLSEFNNSIFIGLHFHIGSQITKPDKFVHLAKKANEIQQFLHDKNINITHLNMGGGLGVNYESPDSNNIADFRTYFQNFKKKLEIKEGQQVHFELGRSIVAQCGSLITRVLYQKEGAGNPFLVVDAGMTELIRPALYKAFHHIENLSSNQPMRPYNVVGPICETSDSFGNQVMLNEGQRGDLLAVRSTGAYAEVMSSRYNLREVAPSVYSDDFMVDIKE